MMYDPPSVQAGSVPRQWRVQRTVHLRRNQVHFSMLQRTANSPAYFANLDVLVSGVDGGGAAPPAVG